MITPGTAYWNQRFALQRSADRIRMLWETVDHPTDFTLFQFAQLLALSLEFEPDLILELGRGFGNSTCVFTEAARLLPRPCRVVSLCDGDAWEEFTVPRLRKVVDDSWFEPLEALRANIVTFDYEPILSGARKVLIFWDAHGFDIAQTVLGRILRSVASKEHFVAMHDMTDLRHCTPRELAEDYSLWTGSDESEGRFCIGHVYSKVPQAISVIDFTVRNKLTLESADQSIFDAIGNEPLKIEEMGKILGNQLFSANGYWFWFSLNEHPGPYLFPVIHS